MNDRVVKRFLPALVFLLVTAAAVSFIYKDKLFPPEPGQGAQSAQGGGAGGGRRGGRGRTIDPNRPVAVLVEEAKSQDVPVYLYGVGTVQASNTVNVRPQVGGKLLEVNVREGQDVKAGDVLAKIDPVTYQAAYDQATAKKAMTEAQLANAKRDLDRFENLAKTNFGTQKDLDTQRALVAQYDAQLRQDQASIDAAKASLDYTDIRAPLSGRTGIRVVDVGNIVSASDTSGIAFITQIQPIDVVFTLPETYVGELVAAQAQGKVELTATVGNETLGDGTLTVVDNRIDETTGTVRLKGSFPNDPVKLWPGQFVNVRLHLKTLTGATVVSAASVQQGSAGRYVYLAQPDNTAKLVPVKVAQENEREAVISEGIKPGDKVVSTGFVNLQDGSKITLESGRGDGQRQKSDQKPEQDNSAQPPAGQPAPSAQNAPPASGDRPHRRRQQQGEAEGRPAGGAAERLPTGTASANDTSPPQGETRQSQ
jgi:multidrug efflux system membrane fusion protein